MSADRYARLQRVYQLALEASAEDRSEVIERECGADSALRDEVQDLLAHAESGDDLLSDAAVEEGRQFANTPVSGERFSADSTNLLGGCRIIRKLGSGGMGVVWEAEQLSPRRRVALKVLGRLATEGLVRRFHRESEALAMLKHPGVAQIFDFGIDTLDGRETPYIVMELVEGLPLSEYAKRHNPSVAERLELIAKICNAVEHAHQHGVIHRDLKPDNILVQDSGDPKVLDFGIAKITQADTQMTRETEVGQIIGTAAYMSPEQASGDPSEIDTRSDVYSLGAVLYEFLTGQLPYPSDVSFLDFLNAIREKEPVRLSSIDSHLRGDIDTIVAKALEKQKDRRYQSAGELADDIRRHLADRPIVAHPPSTLYQLKKFTKRNQLLVTSVCAIILSLVIGLIGTSAALSRASLQRDRAETELARASSAVSFLESTLLSVSPEETKGLDTLLMRTVLDRAAQDVARDLPDQPRLQAQMKSLIGQAYGKINEFELSVQFLEQAVELFEGLGGEQDIGRLRALYALGGTHRIAGDLETAAALLESSLRVFDDHSIDVFDHIDHLLERGQIGILRGEYDLALSYANRAIELQPDDMDAFEKGRAHMLRGNALRRIDRPEEAIAEYLLTRQLYRRRQGGSETVEYVDVTNSLALAHRQTGDLVNAEKLYREAHQRRLAIDPRPDPTTATIVNNLGRVLMAQGKYDEATANIRESVDMHRALFGDEHFGTAIAIMTLAELVGNQGEFDESLALFDEGIALMEPLVGLEHPHFVTIYSNKCVVLIRAERYEEAIPLLEHAIRICDERGLVPAAYKGPVLVRKSDALRGLGRISEAEATLRQAIECYPLDDPRRAQLVERLSKTDT